MPARTSVDRKRDSVELGSRRPKNLRQSGVSGLGEPPLLAPRQSWKKELQSQATRRTYPSDSPSGEATLVCGLRDRSPYYVLFTCLVGSHHGTGPQSLHTVQPLDKDVPGGQTLREAECAGGEGGKARGQRVKEPSQ